VKLNLPPTLAVFVECEGSVSVRVFSESFEDEVRMGVDIEMRAELMDDIAAAIGRYLFELRGRREEWA
jgi:hypothetical protein